jgi:hypothetical protein
MRPDYRPQFSLASLTIWPSITFARTSGGVLPNWVVFNVLN